MRLEDSAGSCGRGSGGLRCSMVEHDSLLFITLTYDTLQIESVMRESESSHLLLLPQSVLAHAISLWLMLSPQLPIPRLGALVALLSLLALPI